MEGRKERDIVARYPVSILPAGGVQRASFLLLQLWSPASYAHPFMHTCRSLSESLKSSCLQRNSKLSLQTLHELISFNLPLLSALGQSDQGCPKPHSGVANKIDPIRRDRHLVFLFQFHFFHSPAQCLQFQAPSSTGIFLEVFPITMMLFPSELAPLGCVHFVFP